MDTFLRESPYLSILVLWLLVWLIARIAALPFSLCRRIIRSRDIQTHGWPPEHLDADGDFRPQSLDD